MENLVRLLVGAIAILLISGCGNEQHLSPEMTEPATVEETIYQTNQHGSGTGVSSKGSMVFTSVDIPAAWAVVFHCEHGKFVIEGQREKHRQLWQKLSKGDHVTVRYKEIYETRDGKDVLVGFDFIDATK